MFVLRNVKARLYNHCCCIKAINITYSNSVFVVLGTPREMRMRYSVICDLSGFTVFFHTIS